MKIYIIKLLKDYSILDCVCVCVLRLWFFAKYPEVMEFGLSDDKKQITNEEDDTSAAQEAEENKLDYEMPVKISA